MNAPARPEAASRSSLNRSAAFASISVALLLIVLKGWAAWTTGSTAMLGSLADTALDLAASIATLIGVWIAAQPADDNHRFGHGKAEAVAAMFQVVLISISALAIAARAVERLIVGGEVASPEAGIGVSIVAIIATVALLAWQRYVIARTQSVAIETDHAHYKSDLLLNLSVIAALAIDSFAGVTGADALFGLAIAIWLGLAGWRASGRALEQLMDQEWPEEKRQRFLLALAEHPELRGVHDLRTRTSGERDFVQFHVWMEPTLSLREAHRIMDEVEARLERDFPDVDILIHPDPEGLIDETGAAAQDELANLQIEEEKAR